jgi:peptidoglycan/LPS O-acetylase OafA/YrhL
MNKRIFRYKLLISSILLIIVAIIVTVGVITPVKNDTSPGSTPQRAVMAFGINVAVSLLVGGMLIAVAIRAKRNRDMMIIIGFLGFIILILSCIQGAWRGYEYRRYLSLYLFCWRSSCSSIGHRLDVSLSQKGSRNHFKSSCRLDCQ